MRYRVSNEVKEAIDLGNQIIGLVRLLLPHGAGNQVFNQKESKGWSSYLTGQAQLATQSVGPWTSPGKVAGAFIKYGAGNCQDQAAVTYLLLREWLSAQQEASFCVANATHHSFSAIGVPNTDAEDEVVIVDPWPKHAQAVLWKHHFCRNDTNFQVLRHKPGGRADKISKAIAKYQHIQFDKDEDYPNYKYQVPTTGNWNHRYCATNNTVYDYYSVSRKEKLAAKFQAFFCLK